MNRLPKLSYLYGAGSLFFAMLAAGLIFLSSQKQSLTVDEPNHLFCGLEWLQEGTYTAWPENPPLSRVLIAIGPYLRGYSTFRIATESNTLFEHFFASFDLSFFTAASFRDQLFWMRITILPMFLLALWIVWFWTRSVGGNAAAFVAAAMFATLPVVLAHSGLATTDISFLAVFTITLFCLSRWISQPDLFRGALLGLSLGASLLTKFSALVFFPFAALFMLVVFMLYGLKESGRTFRQWGLMALRSAPLAAVITFVSIWAFFGFEVGAVGEQPAIQAGIREGIMPAYLAQLWMPAPEWFAGLALLVWHNSTGHPAFLAGTIATHGFWYFYPLAALVKTPWPFLVLLIMGLAGAWLPLGDQKSRNWEMMALAILPFALLVSGLSSNINIGIRHVIVIYSVGAIGGAAGMLRLLHYRFAHNRQWKVLIPAILVFWQSSIALTAFPDYLSYFNPLAGKEPGALLVDSDLDWGQGLFELEEYCRDNQVESLSLSYFGFVQDCWYELPAYTLLQPDSLAEGWIAVSEMAYQGVWAGTSQNVGNCNELSFRPMFSETLEPGRGFKWLDQYPLKAKLAGSIRVYHIDSKK